ncbi:hypothetical protein U1Q18_037593 [Sarracenia purpurea var. burkii]
MELIKEGLLNKVRSVVSVIYGIVLWVTRLSSSIHTPKSLPFHRHRQPGLGALICSTPHNINSDTSSSLPSSSSSSSSMLLSSSSSSSFLLKSTAKTSSSSSWSSTMGDLIGTESGVYTSCSNDQEALEGMEERKPFTNHHQRKRNQKIGRNKRESDNQYPPPLPSLARTGTLTGRMPSVLTRHYTNGRLILREEKVNHFEYFEARRENSRLLLKLIPLDQNTSKYCCCQSDDETVEREKHQLIEEGKENMDEDGDQYENDEGERLSHNDQEEKGSTIVLASSMPEPWMDYLKILKRSKNGEGDIRRCFTFAGEEITNSSFFPVAIPVNKPIDA